MSVLTVTGLRVRYLGGVSALRGVDLRVDEGECLALVGESGSGKSTVLKALLGLLPQGTEVSGTAIVTADGQGVDALTAGRAQRRRLRREIIGYVAQDPYSALDPLHTVGHHIAQAWRIRRRRPPKGAVAERAAALGIPDAYRRIRHHPHQWSGGMLQRAGIAGAGVSHPLLTLADEPTSALDADLADSTLRALRADSAALLLVCHDLRHVREYSDSVAVLYAGRVVETGSAATVLRHPRHPFTQALLAATPSPGHGLPVELPGVAPSPRQDISGCAFAPRCRLVVGSCLSHDPPLIAGLACPQVTT